MPNPLRVNPGGEDVFSRVRTKALDLLARREYSVLELRGRLQAKGFDDSVIEEVIARLASDNLQSDVRFAESYIRSRKEKGFGPLRIMAELRQRGVDESAAVRYVCKDDVDWRSLAGVARVKRFGHALPQHAIERARQHRFLQYRGFSAEQITAAFHVSDDY